MSELISIIFALLLLTAVGYLLLLIIQRMTGKTVLLGNMANLPDEVSLRQIVGGSLTLRVLLIGLLVFVTLFPLSLVNGIVDERAARYYGVQSEISATWGSQQTLLAAVLVVPYTDVRYVKETVKDDEGKVSVVEKARRIKRTAQFLPSELVIEVELIDEARRRGIFKALVYNANIKATAQFRAPDVARLSDDIEKVHWESAWVAIGLTDTGAINAISEFSWNGENQTLSPGTRMDEMQTGFHATLPVVDGAAVQSVELAMQIKGTGAFRFAPFGEATKVSMTSSWPHPGFGGDALPGEYNVSESGFNATWNVPHLARDYPQSWSSAETNIDLYRFTAGANMFEPVSLYSQVTRSVKYGILFIGLTFLTLLVFEMSVGRRMHVVQYVLVGGSLCLFYLILLSLSEHVAFIKAYTVAASLVIAMIAVYVGLVLRSVARAIGIAFMLVSLYSLLFALLRIEDYALLVGTAVLVTAVIFLMIVTRNLLSFSGEHSLENSGSQA